MNRENAGSEKTEVRREDVIIFNIDAAGMEECIGMALRVVPDYTCTGTTVDERTDDLMRLSSLITARYGYVAICHDEDRLPALGAGRSWILPIPSDALRNHCAALEAGAVDQTVEESAKKTGVGPLSKSANMSMLLATRILELIDDSGAAQTEAYAALGVVQCLLPMLDISKIPAESDAQ
jgi:hypothetical protein